MFLEVTGVSTRNKGAELMVAAIQQHFQKHPQVHRAITQRFGSAEERGRYGLHFLVTSMKYGLNRSMSQGESMRLQAAARILQEQARREIGIVRPDEIDGILDASGFALGDQHRPARTRLFADRAEQVRKRGGKIVLLPQAFGPFEHPNQRKQTLRLFELVDLAFARDTQSLGLLTELLGKDERIKLCPDFTITLGKPSARNEDDTKFVSVVPNSRMLDKLAPEVAAQYVPTLAKLFTTIEQSGMQPRLLLHDRNEDLQFVDLMNKECGREVATISHSDPLVLKQYLAESHLVIGSRFHALVGALSSGVPAIAIGWSHKYQELFQDFGVPHLCVDPQHVADRIEPLLSEIEDDYSSIRSTLAERKKVLAATVESMWSDVDRVLGLA